MISLGPRDKERKMPRRPTLCRIVGALISGGPTEEAGWGGVRWGQIRRPERVGYLYGEWIGEEQLVLVMAEMIRKD